MAKIVKDGNTDENAGRHRKVGIDESKLGLE